MRYFAIAIQGQDIIATYIAIVVQSHEISFPTCNCYSRFKNKESSPRVHENITSTYITDQNQNVTSKVFEF